jgi:hypothetical protein
MQLTERDLAILDVACRCRLVTVDAVATRFFDARSLEAARSALRRIERARFVSRHRFSAREPYYQPTERAFALFGDAQSKARPIGAQALPRVLGVLIFVTSIRDVAIRLRPKELQACCSELPLDHPAFTGIHDYVRIRGEGSDELTRVVVDLGGDHRAFAFKLRRSLREMLIEPGFQRLQRDGRLTSTLIFSSESKRDAVQRALRRHATTLPVRFVVVSQLFDLLSGTPLRAEGVAQWT